MAAKVGPDAAPPTARRMSTLKVTDLPVPGQGKRRTTLRAAMETPSGGKFSRKRTSSKASDITDITVVGPSKCDLTFEPTYKTNPDDGQHFAAYKVEAVLKEVLDAYLATTKYEASRCSKLCQDLCSVIRGKTKDFNFPRYKLITQVFVGQDSDQSVQLASRCLWNHTTDSFAASTFRNNSLYAIAVVYGVYLD